MLPRSRMLLLAAVLCLTVGVVDHANTSARVSTGAQALGGDASASAFAAAGETVRVSVAAGGIQANGDSGPDFSYAPSISADGRYIAFDSVASNLVAADTNARRDVFVRDRFADATERVSVATGGGQANDDSGGVFATGDGRYVAFHSAASNLVSGDTNGAIDVFVRDRALDTTKRISVATGPGGAQGNSFSYFPSISADGRYVAFYSDANNLVSGDTNGVADVFVRNLVDDTTERVSASSEGAQGNGASTFPSISADGRSVAFRSNASNLVSGDTNGVGDVFVRNLVDGTTVRASVSTDAAEGNGLSNNVSGSLSADGRYVAFHSLASNLVSGDTNAARDVFLRDLVANKTEILSVGCGGVQGNGSSAVRSISADGRYVAFQSDADANLLAPGEDTNGVSDIFVRDRVLHTINRVSVSTVGMEGNGASTFASITADGRFVAFMSSASNLVVDTNAAWDVFVRDRVTGGTCPPVVVLVHGIDATHTGDKSCAMDGIQTYLTDKANTGGHQFVSGPAECLIYTSRLGVEAGARELQLKIDDVKKNRNVDKVDLVVHSMGGLISRYYIEKLKLPDGTVGGRANVRSLTMLGTPNRGSHWATEVCKLWAAAARADVFHLLDHPNDQGACDMVHDDGSEFLKKLNVLSPGSYAGVTYKVLTGWKGRSPVEPPPNDCVVNVLSAFGLAFDTELFPKDDAGGRVLHVDSGTAGGVVRLVGCGLTGLGEPNDPAVRARVAQILLESNGYATSLSPATSGAAVATPPPNEPAPSTIASQSGLVAQSQTTDLLVTMPPSQPTGTFIFRAPEDPSATLAFALLRPGGTPVATTDADVTHESGAGFGGLTEAHYIIANPAAGTWTMRVTGTTVPPTGWPYDLQALVPGGISVAAKAGAGHYDVGQPFALSADVAVNATPYAGATVSATITKPDNTTTIVALTDIGGGAYTGSFSDTAACGLYQLTITAGGIDSGTPFSRQDRTIAFAGVPGNVILDPCTADSDGDGLTDRGEVDISNSNPGNADTDGDGVSDGPLGLAGPPIVASGPDNCVLVPNADQLNSDAAVNWPWIKDGAPVPEGATLGGDVCDTDIENDGCPNAKEAGADWRTGGQRDATSPWDFFDVPVPALLPTATTGVRNRFVTLADVLADLSYVGTSAANPTLANANGAKYGSDINGNGVIDGKEYDRTPSTVPGELWHSGPPNGFVTLGDVLIVLAQVGTNCS